MFSILLYSPKFIAIFQVWYCILQKVCFSLCQKSALIAYCHVFIRWYRLDDDYRFTVLPRTLISIIQSCGFPSGEFSWLKLADLDTAHLISEKRLLRQGAKVLYVPMKGLLIKLIQGKLIMEAVIKSCSQCYRQGLALRIVRSFGASPGWHIHHIPRALVLVAGIIILHPMRIGWPSLIAFSVPYMGCRTGSLSEGGDPVNIEFYSTVRGSCVVLDTVSQTWKRIKTLLSPFDMQIRSNWHPLTPLYFPAAGSPSYKLQGRFMARKAWSSHPTKISSAQMVDGCASLVRDLSISGYASPLWHLVRIIDSAVFLSISRIYREQQVGSIFLVW